VASLIVLLDTSEDLTVCSGELGCEVEQLLTPLTMFSRQEAESHYAIDNGAFAKFNPESFTALLKRENHARALCRFVAVPDVVGSARRTLEIFKHWQHRLTGWPLALVAQDGIEDMEIPWSGIKAVFIGGSTKFKLSQSAKDVVKAALALSKWIHAGRVNTPARFEYFEEMGAHSIDGTGLSRYSWMRTKIYEQAIKPRLFTETRENEPCALTN
jgi:hypothetical protein